MNREILSKETLSLRTLSKNGISIVKTLEDLLLITEDLEKKYISPKTDTSCFKGLHFPKCQKWLQNEIDTLNGSLDRIAKIIFAIGMIKVDGFEEYKEDLYELNKTIDDNEDKQKLPYTIQIKLVKNGVSVNWVKVGLKVGKNPRLVFQNYENLPQLKNHSYSKSSFNSASTDQKRIITEQLEPELTKLREMTESVGKMRLALITLQRRLDKWVEIWNR